MVKTRYIITALFVLIIGIVAAYHLLQGQEKRVRRQFKLLSELASKHGDEDNLTMARKARGIGALFAENCRIETHIASISASYTRQEIAGLAARARLPFSRLSVRFYDLRIQFPEKNSAQVTVTGLASGALRQGDLVDDTLELVCTLKKLDNKWLFTGIQVVEVLEK